jgi:hypothetical protein
VPVLVPLPLPVELLPPPPPTGAAPPVADETGMLVVVVVDGGVVGVVIVVVVVVVVVVVDPPVPPAAGTEEPVPITARVAVGVEPPLCGAGLAATSAVAAGAGTFPPETWAAPLDWLPVPAAPALVPAELGAVVVGVVPR